MDAQPFRIYNAATLFGQIYLSSDITLVPGNTPAYKKELWLAQYAAYISWLFTCTRQIATVLVGMLVTSSDIQICGTTNGSPPHTSGSDFIRCRHNYSYYMRHNYSYYIYQNMYLNAYLVPCESHTLLSTDLTCHWFWGPLLNALHQGEKTSKSHFLPWKC